jgi:hypothetical protein
MTEEEAKNNLNQALAKHLPSVATNFIAALIIWLFGVLVFIPAAKQILPQRIPLATSLIILIGFTIFVVRAINGGLPTLIKSTSNLVSFNYKNWKNPKISVTDLQIAFKHMFYIAVTVLIYLLYSPFLITINPALNGLTLIPIILWMMWIIMKILNITLLQK